MSFVYSRLKVFPFTLKINSISFLHRKSMLMLFRIMNRFEIESFEFTI